MTKLSILISLTAFSISVFGATPNLKQVFPEGEKLIFSKLYSSYQKQDLVDVIHQEQALRKNYPKSIYSDQATFLRGFLELQKGRYAEALKAFTEIDNKRPFSIKRPEALFAIAMTYKKLELPKQADTVLKRIEKNYPGSPESRRASLERRLIKVK